MQVTSTAEAEARQPGHHLVYALKNRPPGIEFWIPFHGNWSDLVATFEVTEHDGRWAFVLYDLHVP